MQLPHALSTPSSVRRAQSLSLPSHDSVSGTIWPTHAPHASPSQLRCPFMHGGLFESSSGPSKHGTTVSTAGSHGQPSYSPDAQQSSCSDGSPSSQSGPAGQPSP